MVLDFFFVGVLKGGVTGAAWATGVSQCELYFYCGVFIGYSIRTAPIIGYNYGAKNTCEMKNVLQKSILFNFGPGIFMCILANVLSSTLAGIFVSYDAELYEMTRHGFAIYSLSFVVIRLNIYGSAFFTALGNGLISALISFLRTLLFQVSSLLVLPIIFGLDGIWCSIIVAELLALAVTVIFYISNRKKYGY